MMDVPSGKTFKQFGMVNYVITLLFSPPPSVLPFFINIDTYQNEVAPHNFGLMQVVASWLFSLEIRLKLSLSQSHPRLH